MIHTHTHTLNQLAEKDEFEAKQKELEGVVNPILMKVEAKNVLENYCFTMRDILKKLPVKFQAGDQETIESAVQEALHWLDRNQLAERFAINAKQAELEGVVNSIMMRVSQAACRTVEEVD